MSRNNSRRDQTNSYGLIDRREYLKLTGTSTGVAVSGLGIGALGSTSVRAASSVLDDFEDGDIDEYSGNTAAYTVQSSITLEGSYSLECNDTYQRLGHATAETTRGNEYKSRVLAPSGSPTGLGLIVGSQDPSYPFSDCYCTLLNLPDNRLHILRRDGGSSTWLDGVDVSLSTGTEYIAGLRYDSSTVQAVVYDSSGTELASTNAVSDETHSGGTFGFYCGSDVPGYFDYTVESSLGSSSGTIEYDKIDDFENSNLSQYTFDRGESSAQVIRSDTYSGTNPFGGAYSGKCALEISNDITEMISLPVDGLENYPSAGDTISCYVMAADGGGKLNLTYGVQDHENRYYVHVNFNNDEILSMKYDAESAVVLDSQQSGFSLSEDTWYWIEVNWGTDGSHTVELYDIEGTKLAECTGTDSEWTTGGIGYDAYLSSTGGTVYFDRVRIGKDSETQGGWGPLVIPSYDRDTRDADWELVEDFNFVFGTTGHKVNNPNYYPFTVGALAHTYDVREGVEEGDVTTSDVRPRLGLDQISHDIVITDQNGNRAGDQVQLSENLGKVGFTYYDSYQWDEWVENNLGERSSQDELLQAAIDNDSLDIESGDGDVTFVDAMEVLVGLAGIGLAGRATGYLLGAAATLLPGSDIVFDLLSEPSCGYSETVAEDRDKRVWDICEDAPLVGYLASYTLYVPDGLEINIEVDQNVGLPDKIPENTETSMHWRPTVRTDHTIELTQDDYWLS